jgi:hypothetical protein
MMRLLDAVDSLAAGATLHALTDAEPRLVCEELEARGCLCRSQPNPDGGVLTVIRGKNGPG